VTDGRTDRILIARPRLHSMQRGKNVKEQARKHAYKRPYSSTLYFLKLRSRMIRSVPRLIKKLQHQQNSIKTR